MTSKAQITHDPARRRLFCPWLVLLGYLLAIGAWSAGLGLAGCDRSKAPSATAASGKSPKIASLVPAATDLTVAMGASDHLVAISTWDTHCPEVRDLPCVGDYQSTDWEKLAEVRPDVLIVFMAGDRMPAGLSQRAQALGIRLVNVRTETLEDVFHALDLLGELTNERDKATRLAARLHNQIDAVARRVAGRPRVPTVVISGDQGFSLIAGNTFIDDLLTLARGRNVASGFTLRYPVVDRERLIELAPQAIIQLLPEASAQVVQRARQSWQQMPELPAVKNNRVYILTDWYVLQPGSHLGDLAEQFADKLHPPAPTQGNGKP